MTVNTEVSFTIPMNMLPMFGIAIFVAWGSTTCTNTRSRVHPEREPGLALTRAGSPRAPRGRSRR